MENKRGKAWAVAVLLITTLALGATSASLATGPGDAIRGGGTSIVEGGTGGPSFVPLITKFGFHWRNGHGAFECLALAPSEGAGSPGSGDFDTNIMYVTGKITSATLGKDSAVLTGVATVTGAGAGTNRPFTATITPGGPGATLVLEISGLTFKETLLEGQIAF